MKKLWLTYSWEDNADKDVDYIAQELQRNGIIIQLDRWTINAGKRLWDQISEFISNKNECDGWAIFATQNSLSSEPCREELAYALDRALKNRIGSFPIIGIFNGSIDSELIPQAVRTRLYVNTRDPDWKERIKASLEGRNPSISLSEVSPYHLKIHPKGPSDTQWTIEVAPRAGTWSPFIFGIEAKYAEANCFLLTGPRGHPPTMGMIMGSGEGLSADGKWKVFSAQNEATPTMSYFITISVLPERIIFGSVHGPQYEYFTKK